MRGHIRPARSVEGQAGKAWVLMVDLGTGADGKRRQKTTTFSGGRREAERELTRLQRLADAHQLPDPSRRTVAAYLDEWLDDYRRSRLKGQSGDTYAYAVKRLAAIIGEKRLDKLEAADVQAAANELLKAGASPATVKLILNVAHRAFRQAVRLRVLAVNPCDGVEAPALPRHEPTILDRVDCLKLLAAAHEDPCGLAVILALGTGMRIGEVSALAWPDLDLDAGTVRVRHSRLPDGTVKAPKSGKAREVSLPTFAVIALREAQAEQARVRAAVGEGWNPEDLVLCTPQGRHRAVNKTAPFMDRLCKKAGVPRVNFHSLRHAHASLLLQDGENIRTVQERLGHSSPVITLAVYAHVLPGAREATAHRVDGLLGTR